MTERAYTVRIVKAAVLCTDSQIRPCFIGQIVHAPTGEIVWDSNGYTTEKVARLQAARVRRNFEYHLETTGERWEKIVNRKARA